MKRRTSVLLFAGALGASFSIAAPDATAMLMPSGPSYQSDVVTTSDSLPRVLDWGSWVLAGSAKPQAPAPLPKVTVETGETLSSIGAETHRSWQQLASYNHLANPNLITTGEVLTLPLATYVAGPVSLPAPPAPPVHNTVHATSSTYTPTPAPTRSTYVAPVQSVQTYSASSSFQACVSLRESGNNPHVGYAGMYGILPSTWHSLGYSGDAGDADLSTQTAAFNKLYAEDGTQPWSPYDHC